MKRYSGLFLELKNQGRYCLRTTRGADFTSNDYLALADTDRMPRAIVEAMEHCVPTESGGWRLL